MPKRFIKVERAIEKAIKRGDIPKYYYKHGKRLESSPYALARYATGFHGSTWHIGMKHKIRSK